MSVYIYDMYHSVWIRGLEQRYGRDPSNSYGTGVWNRGMEWVWSGPFSEPYNLTCTHIL